MNKNQIHYVVATKIIRFEAAHKLPDYCKGKNHTCGYIHGHSYQLEITVGKWLGEHEAMVIDFKDLKRIINRNIVNKMDHTMLNEIENFPEYPSAERMCIWIWDNLNETFKKKGVDLKKVTLWETATSHATYEGRSL